MSSDRDEFVQVSVGACSGAANAARWMSMTYNGWSNYETWCVNLHLTNDESNYRLCRRLATEAREEAETSRQVCECLWNEQEAIRILLAEKLKSVVDAGNPLRDMPSHYADLLQSAISDVDWDEIATAMLDE